MSLLLVIRPSSPISLSLLHDAGAQSLQAQLASLKSRPLLRLAVVAQSHDAGASQATVLRLIGSEPPPLPAREEVSIFLQQDVLLPVLPSLASELGPVVNASDESVAALVTVLCEMASPGLLVKQLLPAGAAVLQEFATQGEGYAAVAACNFVEVLFACLAAHSPNQSLLNFAPTRNLKLTNMRSFAVVADPDSRLDYTGVTQGCPILIGEETASPLTLLIHATRLSMQILLSQYAAQSEITREQVAINLFCLDWQAGDMLTAYSNLLNKVTELNTNHYGDVSFIMAYTATPQAIQFYTVSAAGEKVGWPSLYKDGSGESVAEATPELSLMTRDHRLRAISHVINLYRVLLAMQQLLPQLQRWQMALIENIYHPCENGRFIIRRRSGKGRCAAYHEPSRRIPLHCICLTTMHTALASQILLSSAITAAYSSRDTHCENSAICLAARPHAGCMLPSCWQPVKIKAIVRSFVKELSKSKAMTRLSWLGCQMSGFAQHERVYGLGTIDNGLIPASIDYPQNDMLLVTMPLLSASLSAVPPQTEKEARIVAKYCCRGLHTLHSIGLVHHDVRAANVTWNWDRKQVALIDLDTVGPTGKQIRIEEFVGAMPSAWKARPTGAKSETLQDGQYNAGSDIRMLGVMLMGLPGHKERRTAYKDFCLKLLNKELDASSALAHLKIFKRHKRKHSG
ncbi:hypothetical protein MMC07_005695 [Pseudocyphellaria aurata]|nr:hypothetical protein [Pseudocyphellaria aurata]